MKKFAIVLILLCVCVLYANADWQFVGTSGFSTTPSLITNYNDVIMNSIAVDNAGNVFATANHGNNTSAGGGVTIFKTDGTKIDIDLFTLGYPGGVTKLVKAGDGKIYALQNWIRLSQYNSNAGVYRDTGVDSRILRINLDGSVDLIINGGSKPVGQNALLRITGMAVGEDGNLYFKRNRSNNEAGYNFRNYMLWRYNVYTSQIESAPTQPYNSGSQVDVGFFDFENAGDNAFATIVIPTSNTADYSLGAFPVKWDMQLNIVGLANMQYMELCTAVTLTAYDNVNRCLYIGSRGKFKALQMLRLNGYENTNGLFDPTTGYIGTKDIIYPNGNNPFTSKVDDGGQWWISAMAVNPIDNKLWIAWTAQAGYFRDNPGIVWKLSYGDMSCTENVGMPDENSFTVGLTFSNNKAYALVCDKTSGNYKVYKYQLVQEAIPLSVREIKNSQNESEVITDSAKKVSAVFDTFFYIQDDDRFSGIKIVPIDNSTMPAVGDSVIVQGTKDTIENEAVITNAIVNIQ
ncbi:MAG: hypothetical protein SNJ70_02980 [Armatimonadota bacterium]